MSEAPFRDRPGADAFLSALAPRQDGIWPLATAALALACRDRPRVDLQRYHRHLADLADELAAEAASAHDAEERRAALAALIASRYGYRGDTLTYEDLQNANLMRVIDRRKGLPVALGILYLHAARAQGWPAAGLAFPGHFLLRLGEGGASLILDPFHDGRACDPAALRELLKAIAGGAAELEPAHYADASDRDVLLRLQNNVKLRLLQAGRFEEALGVIEGMLLFAPDEASLWHEAGLVNVKCDNLRAAIDALERAVAVSGDAALRHHAAALLQQLKARLH